MHGSSNPDQMKIVVPTEEDWGDYQSDLDRKYAHDLFAGHTNEEMRPYFRQNPIERASELRWMPELPFRYYMIGFQDCLMDGDFDFLEASNAANCFLNLILEMLENQPQVIIPIMPGLLPVVDHIVHSQRSYNADESIYGCFSEKLSKIQSLLAAHQKELF
jgi:hypothetical protein